jgi:aminocarboxymuconate-semialdehyde decarboxylase
MIPAVDVHSHVVSREAARFAAATFRPRDDPFSFHSDPRSNAWNERLARESAGLFHDAEARIGRMDAMGIDIQVLSPTPQQYYYWAEPELGARLARIQNENVAEIAGASPERFLGIATLPLQDADLALAELDYAIRFLGLTGVEIGTNVQGTDLDDDGFRPLWRELETRGIAVLLHPHGFTEGQRLAAYYLNNVVGNPMDTSIALSRMIFRGVFRDFPKLRVCAVHGGGFLPFYATRMDHAWSRRPESREFIDEAPSNYLRRIWFDTLVYEPAQLKWLIDRVGAGQVVLGTDFPFDMGMDDPVGMLDAVEGLEAHERDAIRGSNALELFGRFTKEESS